MAETSSGCCFNLESAVFSAHIGSRGLRCGGFYKFRGGFRASPEKQEPAARF